MDGGPLPPVPSNHPTLPLSVVSGPRTFGLVVDGDIVVAGRHLWVQGGRALLGRLARLVVVGRVGEAGEQGEAGHVRAVRVLGWERLVDLDFPEKWGRCRATGYQPCTEMQLSEKTVERTNY